MDTSREDDYESRRSRLEDYFKTIFNPMEPTVMRVQSLLVWENPLKSVVMIVCIHGVFWFLTYGNCHFYSTISSALMIVYFLHTWKKKIWPEIRVPPKIPDSDDWTPVHPRLLSVPELCKHLSIIWCYFTRCGQWWMNLRKNRPFKFFIESSFIFSCGAIVGHYISGVMLSYIIIMSMVLWPCLQYHSLLKKMYMKFEPIFMKLDYSIKVKNKWRYNERAPVTTNENTDREGHLTRSVCADNESDLEDFYPSDPTISAALARAITDSEDEGGTPAALTPGLSKEPSVANSDDEHRDDYEEEENDFALSVDLMPSFEETLDHTDDEMLMPSLPPDRSSRERSEEGMKFVPSYFEDSDDAEDLMPDAREFPSMPKLSERENDNSEHATKALAEQLVSKAFSSVMETAIQNTVMGAFQNLITGSSDPRLAQTRGSSDPRLAQTRGSSDRRRVQTRGSSDQRLAQTIGSSDPRLVQSPGDRVASTYSDSDEDDAIDSVDHGHEKAVMDRKPSEDSGSLNIEEDFEFLNEYELESSTEQ